MQRRNTVLEIPREAKGKLKRYLINADPFLWSVLEGKNKKERLKEIKAMGYLTGYSETANPNYSKINQDLLVEIGIEGILERVVVPRIRILFTSEIISYFRRCWEQGQTPTVKYLRENGLYRRRYRSREIYEDYEN